MLLLSIPGISISFLPRVRSLHRFAPLLLFCWMASTSGHAETISGTVQDPSGAVIAGARIEITGGDLTQPVVLASDGLGKFQSPDLKPGTYSVRAIRDGFEPQTLTCLLYTSPSPRD